MRPYLLLMRAPLAAGAASNLLVGVLLALPDASRAGDLAPLIALLMATSCCLYWGGMVLNDFFDRERDRALFPQRPIPSGRVSAGAAAGLGFGLLALGVAGASLAGGLAAPAAGPLGLPGAARGAVGGLGVAACVLAYDGWLKRYRVLGSAAMGSCRTTNALLGAWVLGLWPEAGAAGPTLTYALLLGLYVLGLTVLSTYEDEDAPPLPLSAAWATVLLGPGLLAGWALLGWGQGSAPHPTAWLGLLPLLGLLLLEAFRSLERGTRAAGHARTRTLLRAIWLLDLGVLLGFGPWPAAAVLAVLYALGTAGAKLLFRPPRRPDPDRTSEGPAATLEA